MAVEFGTCRTCKFYCELDKAIGAHGECRGSTPQAILLIGRDGRPVDKLTYWPQPEPDKWCGMWQPKLALAQ